MVTVKDISIRLDKQAYLLGETVKGTVNISANKGVKAQNFILTASGEEATVIHIGQETFSASNIFFHQDLSHFLTSVAGVSYNNRTLLVTKGIKEIPFYFTIPMDALESYQGKNASILYTINAKEDKSRFLPRINEKIAFGVTKSIEREKMLSESKIVLDKGDNNNNISFKLKLQKDNFSPGETMNGMFSVNNPTRKKIKGVKLSLKGIEYAMGQQDADIEIDTGFGLSFKLPSKKKKLEEKKEKITKIDEVSVDMDWKEGDSIPVEVYLPTSVKRSYIGKFSSYSWVLHSTLNIARSRDLHAEMTVKNHLR